MKILFFLLGLFFYNFSFCQEDFLYFKKEEILNINNYIKSLELKDSLNEKIILNLQNKLELYKQKFYNDSLYISLKEKEVDVLKDINKYSIDYSKPKWFENKYLWFLGGMATMYYSSKIIKNIK